jgi:hypothetical protein
MAMKQSSDVAVMAFHGARKDKIFDAVQAIKNERGLSQGSIFAHGNPYV